MKLLSRIDITGIAAGDPLDADPAIMNPGIDG
jgi:hypothetical protein